LDYQLELEAD